MHGTTCEKGFSGVIIDYMGGGNWDEFYFINGMNLFSFLRELSNAFFKNTYLLEFVMEIKTARYYIA